jgi:hypothetical protein
MNECAQRCGRGTKEKPGTAKAGSEAIESLTISGNHCSERLAAEVREAMNKSPHVCARARGSRRAE